MTLDDGIEVIFDLLRVKVEYEKVIREINIHGFSRTWKTSVDPLLDGDDVRAINTKNMSIDLAPVLREEIIMAAYTL
jgi:hypothetical protein